MNIFNIDEQKMEQTSSTHTLTEINQQPNTWMKTLSQIKECKDSINEFITKVVSEDDFDIIFTGAGTSEFIGNSLFSEINKKYNYKVKSYGTTDIVASPESYISNSKPTLLISFGRSGNSPESIGAVNDALAVSNKVYNLFITCNKNGQLSKMAETTERCYAINLTDETHDASFAMTSSFSNMYLAAYLALNLENLDNLENTITKVVAATENFLNNKYTLVQNIIDSFNFERIVYLGSNVLKGISQESSLKMLELTAGKTVAMFDTPLGFRHGPKSIIDNSTLTVVYLSKDEHTSKYELDLIKEISAQRKGNKLAIIGNDLSQEIINLADFTIDYELSGQFNNIELGLAYITFAQTLSVLKSLSMNLTPDNPCPSGEVNRVVKGVVLYPYSI